MALHSLFVKIAEYLLVEYVWLKLFLNMCILEALIN